MSRDMSESRLGLEGLKSRSRLGTLNSRKMVVSRSSSAIAIFLRFYETAAAYGRFYSLFYSASGKMRNIFFYMNFQKRNKAETGCAVRIPTLHTK